MLKYFSTFQLRNRPFRFYRAMEEITQSNIHKFKWLNSALNTLSIDESGD